MTGTFELVTDLIQESPWPIARHVLVIAEIGINHNGDVGIAKQLIDMAKDAGCDAVKFQKRTIDIVYTKEFLDSPRESPWGTTQRAQKEALEFGKKSTTRLTPIAINEALSGLHRRGTYQASISCANTTCGTTRSRQRCFPTVIFWR